MMWHLLRPPLDGCDMHTCATPSPHPLPLSGTARGSRHRLRACPASPPPDNADAQFDDLRAWVHARGGFVSPSLRLTASDHGGEDRELYVASPVASGTLLASLPRSCCLCLDDSESNEPWPARMAHLVLAAQADPTCAAVTALWPRAVPVGTLAPWPVLQLLGHTLPDVRDAAAGLQLALEKDQHCPSVSDDNWQWALSLALSRVAHPEGCPYQLLAPVFDMANHSGGEPDVDWTWCPDTHALQMRCTRHLNAAGPVRISYGSEHSNSELWLGYGFAVDDNEQDTVQLWADHDELLDWLHEHMGGSEHTAPEEQCVPLLAGRHGALLEPLNRWLGGGDASCRDAIHRRAQQLLDALNTGLTSLDDARWNSADADGSQFLPSLRRLLAAKRLLLIELLAHGAPPQ